MFAVCFLAGRHSEQSGGTFAFLGAKDGDSFSLLFFPGTRFLVIITPLSDAQEPISPERELPWLC